MRIALGLAIAGALVMSVLGCVNPDRACKRTSFAEETAGMEVPIRESALGGDSIAQSFKIGIPSNPRYVSLKLKKVGEILDSYRLYVTIEGDNGSSNPNQGPDGTALAAGYIPVSRVSTTASDILVTLTGIAALEANTTYWLKLRGDFPESATNQIWWMAYDGASGYPNGQGAYETSTENAWDNTLLGSTLDFVFAIGC